MSGTGLGSSAANDRYSHARDVLLEANRDLFSVFGHRVLLWGLLSSLAQLSYMCLDRTINLYKK